MREIFVKLKHCLACRTCEVYCAVAHSASKNLYGAMTEDPGPQPRVKIRQTRTARAQPAQCRHCKKPQCIAACERGAISKDPDTGLTVIDIARCVGCDSLPCVPACPFDAIVIEKDKRVVLVCDQCVEVGDPICVKVCPTKVFALED